MQKSVELPINLEQLGQQITNAIEVKKECSWDAVDLWDQQYNIWQFDKANPDVPKPGFHPWKNHPWNQGADAQDYYIALEEVEPD